MEAIILAVITLIGGALTEYFRRSTVSTNELKEQIALLTAKVEELQDEVDAWQEKYYNVLTSMSVK